MFPILQKFSLNESIKRIDIYAPYIAAKAKAGQFIILRVTEDGERIPLTIADYNSKKGTVTLIFQEIGHTTRILGRLEKGDCILDVVGPLGMASHLEGYKSAAVVGGGLGCAIAYPQAKALRENGAKVDLIGGFRTKDLIILQSEMEAVSDRLFIYTDDGSNGNKGFVTDALRKLLDEGMRYDIVVAIGPPIMMKFVSALTRPYGIKTIVSLNPIMIDGTGMCGCCRVSVGGKIRFACVEGPDFDGHEVDFDELSQRLSFYKAEENAYGENAVINHSNPGSHKCKLEGMSND